MVEFLFGAFAVSTLVSQSLMDGFAILLSVALIVTAIKRKQQIGSLRLWNPVGFDFLFLLWLLVVLIGWGIHGFNEAPWQKHLPAFKWILFFYLLVVAFRRIEPSEKIIKWVCITLLAFGSYAIVVFFIGWDPIKGPEFPMTPVHGGVRTGGLYSNPMTFAHAYGMTFCLLLGPGIYFWRWRRQERILTLATLLVLGISLVLSFTRGAWAGVAAAILVMGFLVSPRIGVVALLGGASAISLTAFLWRGFKDRLLMSLDYANNYDSERVWIWKANWEMVKEYPIFGIGYWNNALKIDHYYDKVGAPGGLLHDHAHNQYLHLLAGTGVVGFLIYLAIVILFFALSWRVFKAIAEKNLWHKGLALGCMGAQICFLVGGLTEANLEHSKIKYILGITWAIVVWLAYEYRVLRERI